ncbi:MAG TPA: hypothetical protein VN802_07285 [Stellaceae bacterium]|nr:hypothetical protein [Stellaceae bacterium]
MADLARLSRAELEARAAEGRRAVACAAALAAQGGVLAVALEGAVPCVDWQHYPAGDVFDAETHAQFFYHAHPPGERGAAEHGHFHTFLRARGMPPGVRPLVLPELAIAGTPAAPAAPSAPQPHAGEDGEWCHLVAIAMDVAGRPIRLFTTNRWVTGETWYRASDVAAMLGRFALGTVGPAPLLNRWIAAMIGFYRPQIEALAAARDEAVMGWRRRRRGKVHVFEDRRLEVTSALDIALEDELAAIEAALAAS